MSTGRIVCAAIVLGLAAAGSVWLATYHVVLLIADRKRGSDPFEPVQLTHVQTPVWWSAGATVVLLVAAITAVTRLEGRGPSVIRGLGRRLAGSRPL